MPRRRSSKTSIVILTAGFSGPSKVSAEALVRHLRGRSEILEITTVDLFDEIAPSLGVLARFAHQDDARFFPAGVVSWSHLAAEPQPLTVVAELASSGTERLAEILARLTPDAVIATFPLAGAFATHLRTERTSFVSAVVLPSWDPRGALVDPATDLCFVACREASDDLVVAGFAYDRITISGIPTCAPAVSPASTGASASRDRFTVLLAGAPGAARETVELATGIAASGLRVSLAPPSDDRARRLFQSASDSSALITLAESTAAALTALTGPAILVSPAGSGLLVEAMGLGRPAIVYTRIAAMDVPDTDFLVNSGAVLVSRDAHDVFEKVRFLYSHRERVEQMGACASALMRADAAQVVCDRVLGRVR